MGHFLIKILELVELRYSQVFTNRYYLFSREPGIQLGSKMVILANLIKKLLTCTKRVLFDS